MPCHCCEPHKRACVLGKTNDASPYVLYGEWEERRTVGSASAMAIHCTCADVIILLLQSKVAPPDRMAAIQARSEAKNDMAAVEHCAAHRRGRNDG